MNRPLKILFDFDGTICRVETIPYVAACLKITNYEDIVRLTDVSCHGVGNYERNLRKRVGMMRGISVEDFIGVLNRDLLRESLVSFISGNKDICEIVSCNLDCWCVPFTSFMEVPTHFSKAFLNGGCVQEIECVADKVGVVEDLRKKGFYVVFVGDSANDLDAMTKSDEAILIDNGYADKRWTSDHHIVIIGENEIITHLESIIKNFRV